MSAYELSRPNVEIKTGVGNQVGWLKADGEGLEGYCQYGTSLTEYRGDYKEGHTVFDWE